MSVKKQIIVQWECRGVHRAKPGNQACQHCDNYRVPKHFSLIQNIIPNGWRDIILVPWCVGADLRVLLSFILFQNSCPQRTIFSFDLLDPVFHIWTTCKVFCNLKAFDRNAPTEFNYSSKFVHWRDLRFVVCWSSMRMRSEISKRKQKCSLVPDFPSNRVTWLRGCAFSFYISVY